MTVEWLDEEPVATAPEAAPPPPPRKRLVAVPVVAALALGLAVGVVIGRASASRHEQPQSAKRVQVAGMLSILNYTAFGLSDSTASECSGTDATADVRGGATVLVRDTAGTTLASGVLDAGHLGDKGCEFSFELAAPAGRGHYLLQIGGHKPLPVEEADLASIRLNWG